MAGRRNEYQCCPLFVLRSAVLLPKVEQSCCLLDSLPPPLSVSLFHFHYQSCFLPLALIPPIYLVSLHTIFNPVIPPFLYLPFLFHFPSYLYFHPPFFFCLSLPLSNPVFNSLTLPSARFASFPSLCQSSLYLSLLFLPTVSSPPPLACCIIQMCIFHFFSSLHQLEISIGGHRKVNGQSKSAIYPDLLSNI